MSRKNGGTKRRRWHDMQQPGLSRWNCPGCGCFMNNRNGAQWGDPCGACAPLACKGCGEFKGHDSFCKKAPWNQKPAKDKP